MKKIFFATTALVATAGVALADVAITGAAEMGIGGGGYGIKKRDFHIDAEVDFKVTGEADNGLTFGAFVSTAGGGEKAIFISAGGATLTMGVGDTDGAYDNVLREVNYAAGSIEDAETNHVGFSTNRGLDGTFGDHVARFDYAFSGVTASLSAEINDGTSGINGYDLVWAVGVRYEGDLNGVALGVGLGYQDVADLTSLVGLSVDAGFSNGLTVGFNYSDWILIDDSRGQHGAIGLSYEKNALAIGVNLGHYARQGHGVYSGVGLAASYDLGSGLSAKLGYGYNDQHNQASSIIADFWSIGLAMSF